MPDVSERRRLVVVSVIFNNDAAPLRELLGALSSECNAAGFDTKVVAVVNDGRAYGLDPSIEVLQGHGNIGFAAGVALGVAQSTPGDVVMIVNPDCELLEGGLDALLMRAGRLGSEILSPVLMDADGEADYRAYESWVFTPGRRIAERVCRRFVLRGAGERMPAFVKAPGTCLMMTQEVASGLGGPFDKGFFLYGEDRDLSLRARRAGVALELVRGAAIGHRGGESGREAGELVTRCKLDSMVRIADRRYGYAGRLLALADIALQAAIRGRGRRGWRPAMKWLVGRWWATGEVAPLTAAQLADFGGRT